jgi:hypothetical protein
MRPQIPEMSLRESGAEWIEGRIPEGQAGAVTRRESGAGSGAETGDDNGLTMAQHEVELKADEARLIVRLPRAAHGRTEGAEAIVAIHA